MNQIPRQQEKDNNSFIVMVGLICAVSAAHAIAFLQVISNSAQTMKQQQSTPVISAILLPARAISPPKVSVVRHKLNNKTVKKKTTQQRRLKKQITQPSVNSKQQTVALMPSNSKVSLKPTVSTNVTSAQTAARLMPEAKIKQDANANANAKNRPESQTRRVK